MPHPERCYRMRELPLADAKVGDQVCVSRSVDGPEAPYVSRGQVIEIRISSSGRSVHLTGGNTISDDGDFVMWAEKTIDAAQCPKWSE